MYSNDIHRSKRSTMGSRKKTKTKTKSKATSLSGPSTSQPQPSHLDKLRKQAPSDGPSEDENYGSEFDETDRRPSRRNDDSGVENKLPDGCIKHLEYDDAITDESSDVVDDLGVETEPLTASQQQSSPPLSFHSPANVFDEMKDWDSNSGWANYYEEKAIPSMPISGTIPQ